MRAMRAIDRLWCRFDGAECLKKEFVYTDKRIAGFAHEEEKALYRY